MKVKRYYLQCNNCGHKSEIDYSNLKLHEKLLKKISTSSVLGYACHKCSHQPLSNLIIVNQYYVEPVSMQVLAEKLQKVLGDPFIVRVIMDESLTPKQWLLIFNSLQIELDSTLHTTTGINRIMI